VLSFGVLRVDLDELCEVATVAQSVRNRAHVGLESIGADLEVLAAGRGPQTLNERVRGGLAAPAQSEVENELGVPLDGNEAVGVADAVIVRFKRCLVAFLFLDKSSDFIALNVLHGNIDDQTAHEFFALLASFHQDFHEGIDVQIGNALRAPQAVAFDHKAQGQHDALLGDIRAIQRGLVGFGIGFVAPGAAEALKAVPVRSEALTDYFTITASRFIEGLYLFHHDSILQQPFAVVNT
jgi:hypothetical protein